ncbi:MAG: alkaline phosphatase family protein [Clostridia bacterium]|nr:alkaline phosphatase family protein [Clostridia bacterium]
MNRKYEHVIVLGIDGAGSFIKDAVTPNFDRIFENGAVIYDALASNPSISAECWGSMLLGVGPEVHKLTNGIVSSTPYPVDSAFPSLFRRIKEAFPEAELGSFCDWNPITYGIVENNLGVSHDSKNDDELTPIICDYIRSKKPDFLFIQFDSVDGAGHRHGYGTIEHLKRIGEVDVLVNDVYTAAADAGIIDETLFIVIADHGGTNPGDGSGGGHGGWTDGEKYVTFAAAGKGINNTVLEKMNIRDLAAIVLYAFGIEAPEFDEAGWTSQIPEGLFNDSSIGAYRDISHLTGAAPRISKVAHTSELIQED